MLQLLCLANGRTHANQARRTDPNFWSTHQVKCFGIPISGPANVFCDNNAVVKNTSHPESVLNKKHNAINFHIVRESVAAKIMRVGKEDTATNIADVFAKLVPFTRKRELLSRFLWDR